MQPASQIALCSPGHGMACFACCPPIRPPGYNHAPWKSSLRRLFIDNTEAIRSGRLPDRVMLGFWCPGLGFLDPKGRTIGCLLHPAQNNGQDLRGPTGYQEKCARESCSQARAFAALPPQTRDRLAGLCCGMDSFAFSSSANPLMKLLAFGPVVAAAVHEHAPGNLEDLQGLAWLGSLKPHLGWLLGSMVHKHGSAILEMADAADRTQDVVKEMARRMGPPPPLDSGQYLHEMCDEWESRFWKAISGRNKARPIDLRTWREHAADLM